MIKVLAHLYTHRGRPLSSAVSKFAALTLGAAVWLSDWSVALSQAVPARVRQYVSFSRPQNADDLAPNPPGPVTVVRGEMLVRFRPTVTRVRQQGLASRFAGEIKWFNSPVSVAGTRKRLASTGASVFDQLALVRLPMSTDLAEALRYFQSQADVVYAEPNYRLQITDAVPGPVVPNDFDFAQLWGMQNTGQGDGTVGADISAPEAWSVTTGDRSVIVAIVDTGLDYFHPDLADNVWTNSGEVAGNGLDDDGNGYVDDAHGYDFVSDDGDPMDDHGHGTHVAGTIGAVGNNGIGVAGVCWQVSLMALKAFDETGNGAVDTAVQAIQYALDNGARVINASWGNYDKSLALEDVLQEAYKAGVLVVAAAGNDNTENAFYPAAYDHVIGVGASDATDQRSRFSNYGAFVELAAPGENIYSTIPNNAYAFYSGTSMAAPHVSGIAALVRGRHPEFTNDELENVLRNSVDVIAPDKPIGTGRVNAAAAVRVTGPLPQVKLNLPDTIFGDIDISGTAQGDDFSKYVLEYGPGTNPTNWTSFYSSPTPVPAGTLFQSFFTPTLGEGTYTFRLTAENAVGGRAVERASVRISNVHLSWPIHDDILRAGEKVNVIGTVYGGNRTYTLEIGAGPQPTVWSTTGVTLPGGGTTEVNEGTLAVWDTSQVPANQFYTLRLTSTATDQSTTQFLTHLVYLDGQLRPGWPQYIPIVGTYPNEDWRNVVVADIDHDGFDEIILLDHGNSDGNPAHLMVYRYDGSLFWSKELAAGAPYVDIPAVGDVDGDGFMEIFVDVGSDGQLFAFRYDGSPLAGKWPVQLEATGLGKVLADLNGDGKKEIIGLSQNTFTQGQTDYRQLVVYDYQGNLLNRWELQPCDAGVDVPRLLPAVGNLDDQPDLEIVAPNGCNRLSAFKMSLPGGPLWSAEGNGSFVASPVVADLDGGGTNSVVIGAYNTSAGTRGGLYVFSNDGQRRPGWPVLVEESFASAPAVADLDGHGQLVISIPSSKSGLLHLVRPTGFEVDGWPVGPISNSSTKSSSVIGDVDGDGRPDIVLSSPGYFSLVQSSGDLSEAGGVKAWHSDGTPISLTGSADLPFLVMEGSVGSALLKAAPVALADIDHNGKLDIIATSVQDRTYLPLGEKSYRKNRSSLYVWELNTPYAADRMPWPMLQKDPEHTGYAPAMKRPNQAPVVGNIPNQIVAPGGVFFPIHLDQYVDDPDNTPRQISWTASGNQNLQITISSNHLAIIHTLNPIWSGVEEVLFTATDPDGLSGSATASFEVRFGYVGPIAAADNATTIEAVPVEIDVLANDRDPNGYALALMDFSRPALGKVTRTKTGTLLYTPNPYAFGQDTFTYTISNGQGGISIGTVTIDIAWVNNPPTPAQDFVLMDEDTSVGIDVLANDTDPDNDPLLLMGVGQPSHGSVKQGQNGVLTYVPATHYFGTDSFDYTVGDPHGGTNQATVNIIINHINVPPVAQDQSFTLNRNSSENITFLASDPDDTQFTFTVIDSPRHGTLWNYPTVATYYPTNGFAGEDSFTYRANDGKDDGPIATVHLSVLEANNPPTADDITIVSKVDQPVTIRLVAEDLDDDPLTYQIVAQPQHGTLTSSQTNYVYQPQSGFMGSDPFTFRAFDGKDWSAIATVTLTITDKNTAPVAQDFNVRVLYNTSTNIALRATDPESDSLTFHVVSRPVNGKLTGKGQNLVYSPNAYFVGADRFTFKADDGQLESQAATVSITVDTANHAPVTTNQQVTVIANTPTPILLAVLDPDGDSMRCPVLKGPKHGVLSGLGTNFVYRPTAGYLGSDSFTYKAWDGQTYSREGVVTIVVTPAVPPIPLEIQSIQYLPGGQIRLRLSEPNKQLAEVQVSADLLNWTVLPQGTTENGTITFTDPRAAASPHRFYRLRQFQNSP